MRVIIQKGPFEKYDLQGEEHEVIAALEQLGFNPERYIMAHFEKKEEPKEPQWEQISYDDIKAGDIIRVTADEDGTLLSGSMTGRDDSGRAQRTRIAHSYIGGGWKDMEHRTVAMCYTKYSKIERMTGR